MKTLKKLSLFDLSKEQITLSLAEMQEVYGGTDGNDCIFQTMSIISAYYGGTSGYQDYYNQYSGDHSNINIAGQARLLNKAFEGHYIESSLSAGAIKAEIDSALADCKVLSVNIKQGMDYSSGTATQVYHNVPVIGRRASDGYLTYIDAEDDNKIKHVNPAECDNSTIFIATGIRTN